MADLKVGRIEQLTHTPGPWEADITRPIGPHAGSFTVTTDAAIVICGRMGWPSRAAESAANARLIAAAPDLLAALKDCCAALGGTKANPDAIPESALIAIAKAEGR